MGKFWSAVENYWNSSRAIAWLLVLCGMGLALWTAFLPQSPGVSIGLLALVAGVMSVRPKMHPAEKFAWVAVLITFTILEVLAIGRADKAAEATREAQNQAFNAIAERLEQSITASKSQYDSTIGHVDSVLNKTQEAAGLAKESIEGMVGTGSYLAITPQHVFSPVDRDSFFLVVTKFGKHIVWDGEVLMAEGPMDEAFFTKPLQTYNLKPITDIHMDGLGVTIHPSKDKENWYGFSFSSRATAGGENLEVRFNKDKSQWEYQGWIFAALSSKHGKMPPPPKTIKHIPWTVIPTPIIVKGN